MYVGKSEFVLNGKHTQRQSIKGPLTSPDSSFDYLTVLSMP